MKTFTFSMLAFFCLSLTTNAQKYDREYFTLNRTHLPEKLIYDQLKTYGTSVNLVSSTVNTDYNFANSLVGNLTSYDKVDFMSADMQIKVNLGPYSFVEEKTVSRTATEEVNKQKVTTTYFKRVHSFRFPANYTVTNRKNSLVMFSNDYAYTFVRSIESSEFKTETEAIKNFEGQRAAGLTANINEHIRLFEQGANDKVKDLYDFYSTPLEVTIFQFKKWDKDDEYNAHIKTIKKVLPVMTADESTSVYLTRLKPELDYLKSFEGVFNPKDKKEDILYFGNYYNLATIYFCLDDFEKAAFYISKLDSVDKKEDLTASLKSWMERTQRRMNKQFLTGTHLNYNPVKDYKLAGKVFTSDAMSSSEAAVQSLSQGTSIANDVIKTSEGKEQKGKLMVEKETGLLKFISTENPSQAVSLTPINTSWFKKDSIEYMMAKSDDKPAIKNFYRVYFSSDKIKLLQLVNAGLVENEGYIGIMRPTEDYITFIMGLSIKKNLKKYFENCPVVSEKAGDGEYGGSMSKDKITKYIQMCTDYSASCGK